MWAALVAAMALVGVVPAASAATCRGADAPVGSTSTKASAAALRCLVNHERRSRGLAPLASEKRLRGAATRLAKQMVARRFFAHVTPDGRTLLDRLRSARYVTPDLKRYAIAENLGYGTGALSTPRTVVNGWLRSSGHRANMLSGRFRQVGIGASDGSPFGDADARTFVADFGLRVRS
jgi:uncharacterized protein YkwD